MNHISTQERLHGAIWGQFIGDASASGNLTHYGLAALVLLNSLISKHGFSVRDFGTYFVETFASPEHSHIGNKTARETIENYHLALEEGHPDLGYEFQGGANTNDVDNATRFAPLVAFYRDDPYLFSIIDKATRVTQNNEFAVAYMRSYARILCHLFTGEDIRSVIFHEAESNPSDTPIDHHVRNTITRAISLEPQSVIDATNTLGNGSSLDQCYPAAIHAILKHAHSFKECILATLQAGGDTAGRAAIVGAWLGAHLGTSQIPQDWRHRLNNAAQIDHAIESLSEHFRKVLSARGP